MNDDDKRRGIAQSAFDMARMYGGDVMIELTVSGEIVVTAEAYPDDEGVEDVLERM